MAILADRGTSIIIQGITGREAASFTKDMLDFGSRVVAGVTPGREGRKIHGIPVFDCVRTAVRIFPAEASVISVPPAAVKDATLEAMENGIRLVVIVTERVPRKDTVEIIEWSREIGVRIIGPNSLGLISPGLVKIGMAGGPVADVNKAFSRGPAGIISRSGGMTTEIANLLTTNGIGQSTCISVGGDPIVGSNFLDLIPLFMKDPETRVVIIFCEPGGTAEEDLAGYVLRENLSLPIVAFVAGQFADEMPGVRFGHAGVIVQGDEGKTITKIQRFREAGIHIAEKFSDIVPIVRSLL